MRLRRSRRAFGAVIVGSLVAVSVTGATAQTADPGALADARARIEAVEGRIRAARGDAAAVEQALAVAQADLAGLEQAVNAVAAQVEAQAAEVRRAEAGLTELRAHDDELRSAVAAQITSLYKHGSARQLEALFGATDPRSALIRVGYLERIVGAERAAIEAVHASSVALEAERTRVDEQRRDLAAAQAEQEALLDRALAVRDDVASRLTQARGNVAGLIAEREDLSRDAKVLEELIRQAAAAAASAGQPSTAGYIWPICRAVTSEFGRRWGRMHEGIDIDGDTGDPIVASKAGVVIFAGTQGGYGQLTLIDHGDGVVTAYAHQSAIGVSKGQRVERGRRIGSIGSTGHSTGSHLHFETRVHGAAQNPRRFLPGGC